MLCNYRGPYDRNLDSFILQRCSFSITREVVMETVVILIFLPLLAVAEFFLVEKRIEKEKLNARYLPLLMNSNGCH
jgi:hypothetical protein